MSREETVERLKKKFLDKELKDEVVIVLAALSADLPEEKVEKYMTTELNADQLIEMMVAIMDGLPETTLETFATGKTEAEDMRKLRLQLMDWRTIYWDSKLLTMEASRGVKSSPMKRIRLLNSSVT